MSAKISGGLLLGGLVLASAACAQSAHDRNSESAAPSPPRAPGPAAAPDLPRVEQLIVAETNRFRRQHGRGDVRPNPKLAEAARDFAAYLARTGKFSHTADGRQPWDRTAAKGYQDCIIAENIAWELNAAGFTTRGLAQAFVQGWEKSPEHRKNMLDPDVTEIGVGVSYAKDANRYYAVQDFGRPKSEAIVFTVSNEADAAVQYTVDGQTFTIQPHYIVTHQRCRPPELAFRLPGEAAKPEVFHPHNGERLVVRKDAAGHVTVVQE